jgi:hypothetical protein
MSKRFIISEQERTHILGLYEQLQNDITTATTTTTATTATTSSTATTVDENSVNIGYLVNLSNSGGADKSPEEMAALKNARIYFENLRDGVSPLQLTPADRVVVNYSIQQTKNLPYEEKVELEKLGKGVKSV